jgi:para-nitrobenzyl esterase
LGDARTFDATGSTMHDATGSETRDAGHARDSAASAGHDAAPRDVGHLEVGGDSGGSDSGHAGDAQPDGDAAAACPTVETAGGPLLGKKSGPACAYLGVPFAAPPVGDLRWKEPQPAPAWTSPRPSEFAPDCAPGGSSRAPSSGEDCLYLNVWTPAGPAITPRAAMVFVHGGGFISGSAADSTYDGAHLAATTGTIVITTNYRLGVFGFLSSPALRAEDPHGSAGNYGILDQIAAFEWVKANATSFGGSGQVAIFGQSAGGISMLVQLASPVGAGSFDAVLVESADAPNDQAAMAESVADSIGDSFASEAGCSGATLLSCLRAATSAQVESAAGAVSPGLAFTWSPVIDGYVLEDYPMVRIQEGQGAQVPTLIGTNADDGVSFVGGVEDASSYLAFADLRFPGHGAAVVAQYPASAYGGSYNAAAAAAFTDGAFTCPARTVARGLTAGGAAVYRYQFTHTVSLAGSPPAAFHGAELEFVFGNAIAGGVSVQPAEVPLEQAIEGYWAAMAATGDPNGGGRLEWPLYQVPPEPDLVLDLPLSTETGLDASACAFWDALN